MDVRQLTRLRRARIRVIVACAAVGAGSAFIVSSLIPTVYEAKAFLIAQRMASTYAEVAKSRPVLEDTITKLGLPVTPEALSQNVDAMASQTSALLTISARDTEASRAAAIASTIVGRLVQLAPGISGWSVEAQQAIQADLARVQREIDRTESAIADLSAKPYLALDDAQTLRAEHDELASLLAVRANLQSVAISFSDSVLTILALAVPPTEPHSPKVALASVVGGLAGLAIGIGVLVFLATQVPPDGSNREVAARPMSPRSPKT